MKSLFCCLSVATAGAPALAQATTIQLSTGETLVVDLVGADDGLLTVVHPVLGELTVKREAVAILPAVTPDTPVEIDDESRVSFAPMQDPAIPDAEEDTSAWASKFVLSAGYTDGNSDTRTLVALFDTTRETDFNKTTFDAGLFWGESEGERTEYRITAGVVHDWFIEDSRWLYFADARYDYDSFQDWDSRVNAHIGAGYKLIEGETFWLTPRAGIGFVKEFGSENDDYRPEALIGVDGGWKISEKQELTFSSYLYPDLDDTGEFRNVNKLDWSVLLDEETNLSLTAGIHHEHQTTNEDPIDKNDVRAYLGLQLEW